MMVAVTICAATGTCRALEAEETPPSVPFFQAESYVVMIDLSLLVQVDSADPYPPVLTVDGRTAFYLKGKIQGRYILTMAYDSGEDPDSNPNLAKIDPEHYYPVYGDGSTGVDDAQSQGKLYLSLSWDACFIMIGDYQIAMGDTALARYYRSLYGFRMKLDRPWGLPASVDLFASRPSTVPATDILRCTGGSLYYLKNDDVVAGSEQIRLEVRSAPSGEIIRSTPLLPGSDYEMDYVQGRFVLHISLPPFFSDGSITRTSVDGNPAYLVINYEYESTITDRQTVYGSRGIIPSTPRFSLGYSYVSDEDYRVYGADLSWTLFQGVRVYGEWAHSEDSQDNCSFSPDGGLTFDEYTSVTQPGGSNAWKTGVSIDLTSQQGFLSGLRLDAYYQNEEAGFSAMGIQTAGDTWAVGADLKALFGEKSQVRARYYQKHQDGVDANTEALLQFMQVFDPLKLTLELHYLEEADLVLNTEGHEWLGGLRLDYRLSGQFALYGSQQLTLVHDVGTPLNHRTVLGMQWNPIAKVDILAEGFLGSRGDGYALVGQYHVTEAQMVYGKVSMDNAVETDEGLKYIAGYKGAFGQHIAAHVEGQSASGNDESSTSAAVGLDLTLAGWLLSLEYTGSDVERYAPYPGGSGGAGFVDRSLFNAGLMYKSETFRFKSGLELRFDDGTSLSLRQILTTNLVEGSFGQSFSYRGQFNYALTEDRIDPLKSTDFIEGELALAYRPVTNDRFNSLFHYSYHSETPADEAQPGGNAGERWHLVSLEGLYDLTPKWQFGQKLAWKYDSIELPEAGVWVDNQLLLWISRLNYRFLPGWELCGEYRLLRDLGTDEAQGGLLAAVFYNITPNLKLGGGYNFTTYNDDLSEMEDAGGWFLDLLWYM